jgi:hypothetical protein
MPENSKRREAYRAGASLEEILAESARLRRQSAGMLKRIAELDKQIAARLPLIGAKPPRRKP